MVKQLHFHASLVGLSTSHGGHGLRSFGRVYCTSPRKIGNRSFWARLFDARNPAGVPCGECHWAKLDKPTDDQHEKDARRVNGTSRTKSSLRDT
jgi:hypothetical protein